MKKILFLFILPVLIMASCATAPKMDVTEDGTKVYSGTLTKPEAKSSISGIVKDAKTGKGIPGARVEIKNANLGVGYYLKKTGSDGRFKIDDFITQVEYVIEVEAKGYLSYKSRKKIRAGKQEIVLQPEAVISGKVTDSSGRPIAGAEVKLGRSYYYSNNRPQITTTDKSGMYRFEKIASGRYLATFSAPGYITETARMKYIKTGESFSLPMTLIRPATVSGKVLITGLKVPAVDVTVSLRGPRSHSTATYQDGTFRIEDIKPGTYQLQVYHQGFYTQTRQRLYIQEGSSLSGQNFTVKPKEPRIEVHAYRYTFTPGNKVSFNLRTFRLESVDATIYSVPINILLKGGIDPSTLNPGKNGFKTVKKWKEGIKHFRPYHWRYQALEVKSALATGGYCIEVKGPGGLINRKFFTVTNVGVILKRSRTSVFAYATNLVTNKPINNAKIVLLDLEKLRKKRKKSYLLPKNIEQLPGTVLLKGTTNKDGIFHKKFSSGKAITLVAVGDKSSYAICNSGSPSTFTREKIKHFIYTDRPVYRAGDTVYYKIVAKTRKKRFVPLANKRIYYKIKNSNLNKTIKEGWVTLDEWGAAYNKVTLSKETTLGTYYIQAGPGKHNLYSNGKFYVEQYRKPEFRIELTPTKDYFINGDTVGFRVEAKYFFGAPLKNALVRYRFYEKKLRSSESRYWWEEGYSNTQSYSRIKLEGDKYVDAEGITTLTLDAGNYPYDREITLEATVIDKTNISITSRKTIRVGRGEYYIKIQPKRAFYRDNDKKEVVIRTVTQSGKPIAADIRIKLYRYIWKPWHRVYVHDKKPVFSQKVTTDKKGYATITLPKKFVHYGEFDILASGRDRRDNVITASRVVWIYGGRSVKIASKFKNFELVLSSGTLKKPQQVTFLVKSKYTDAYVCLTLEGRDIYESKVVKMTSNITPVTFNIRGDYAPNLYVQGMMQRKRALYTRTMGISLPQQDTTLNIAVKTDKTVYKPGDKATVFIKTTNGSGKGIPAELSLAAVDEAIYQIRHDHTPKMQDYFYTKISNWVLTSYSYPITLLAGAGKDGKIKVRHKFEDTAFWKSSIKTGKNGTARVTITLPDNLTTWRLTARGHDKAGRVGEKKKTFLVTQDIIARFGKPRFMVEGDRVGLIGIVNSNTMTGFKDIKTSFKVNEKALVPDKKQKLSLPGFGSVRSYYTYTVPKNTRQARLFYSAKTERQTGDALYVDVPIERRGSAFKFYGIGDMDTNRSITIAPLKTTDNFEFVPEKVTVTLNPSPVVQMLRATEFLSQYPYGCIEQTLNRFIPNLALQGLLKRKGYEQFINKKARKDLNAKVRVGVNRVLNYQNTDGTWGWFYGDRGNVFLTGYVMYSMHLAKKAGYSFPKYRTERALRAVERILSNDKVTGNDGYAYMLYIYSLYGKWHENAYQRLIKLKSRNAYQNAFLVRAVNQALKSGAVKNKVRTVLHESLPKLVKLLKSQINKDEKGVYWKSHGSQRWSWPGGNIEITSYVLAALVEVNDRSTLPAQIVRSLAKRVTGNSWRTTKATAHVIFAITAYLEKKGSSPVTKGTVDFSINNDQKVSISYDLEKMNNVGSLTKTIEINSDKPVPRFKINATGTAGKDVSYDVVVSGTLYYKNKGFLSIFKSEEGSLDSLSNGIRITRSYASIMRVTDMNRNEYLVPQTLDEKKEVKIGDELMVKVRFVAQDNFKYLILEDYLPAGFEVTKKDAYEPGLYKPYIHKERWDNRMIFFFSNIQKGKVYEVAYIIRAELPGNFMSRPTRIECMYEPSIQGWSSPVIVDVDKK